MAVELRNAFEALALEATLSDIRERIGGGGVLTTLQALLEDIKQNTADIELTAGNIAIDADTLNLNTDNVEALLGQIRDAQATTTQMATALERLTQIRDKDGATETSLSALLAEFRNRYDVVQAASQTYVAAGPHDLVNPVGGQRLRTVWLFAQAKGALQDGVVEVEFSLGTNVYVTELTGSQPFAHSAVWEGDVDEALVVETSSNAAVIVNADYRSF